MLLFLFPAVTVDRTVTCVRYNSSNDSSATAVIQIVLCWSMTNDKLTLISFTYSVGCNIQKSVH